jgi:hypothetical protein
MMISNAMRNTMTGLENPQIHRFCSIKKQLWVTAAFPQEGAVVVVGFTTIYAICAYHH